jgi:rsbT co-antagonist protein RsbR
MCAVMSAIYERFFQMSLEMMATAGPDGHFRDLNPVWESVLGYTLDELRASPFVSFVHPDDVERTHAEAAKLFAGEKTIRFENRYRCRNGEYKWVSWVAIAPPGDGLIYATARDITEYKLTMQDLQQTQDQLLRRHEQLQATMQAMSTPLIPITDHIMVMPLVGVLDDERAQQVLTVALAGAQESRAQVVIIDITGMRHVDTSVAATLINTSKALRLLGAHTVLTGIRADMAQTLVRLGVDLSDLTTRSTLQSAIAHALAQSGELLGKAERKS